MSIVDYQIEMMRKFYGGTDNTHDQMCSYLRL